MPKRKIPISVDVPTLNWLDRQISKGIFASYAHAARLGFKLLRKSTNTTIKFKKPNFAVNGVNEKNDTINNL